MSAEENKAVVRREVEELYNHAGNLDAADEIFSPDYVSYEPTSGETRGIEGARRFAATFREAFPDLRCAVEDTVAEGDKVVMRFRGGGTHQGDTEAFGLPTGRRMEMRGITIKRLCDNKIMEAWTNSDALGMMRQLGMVPEPRQADS